jgi:DNA-binding LacI/PurR family transcriptional regulator
MATIDDVARAAGVSISTVSYALSGKRPVAVDTRRRIQVAIDELGYRPNAGARMLAGRRTRIFALTEPLRLDTHAPTHMAFVLATAIAARKVDYDVLLLTDAETTTGMQRVADSALADAVLVLDVAPDDDRVALARRIPVPSVFIGVPDDHDGLVCVDLDFEAATIEAVDRLAALGHRRIGMLGHPEVSYDRSNFPPRVREAFRRRADDHGIAHDFRHTGVGATSTPAVRQGISEMLDAGATAILLHCSDTCHAIALAALDARGLDVPTDISLISVGSSFDTATLSTPIDALPLIPEESCERAVALAMACLDDGRCAPGVHLIPPTYRSHASIAPPPAAARRAG